MPLMTSTGTEGRTDVGGSASPRLTAIAIVLTVFTLGVTLIACSLPALSETKLHTRIVMGVGVGLVIAAVATLIEYVRYRRFVR